MLKFLVQLEGFVFRATELQESQAGKELKKFNVRKSFEVRLPGLFKVVDHSLVLRHHEDHVHLSTTKWQLCFLHHCPSVKRVHLH